MALRKDQYVDLLNTLLFLGVASFETEWNMNEDFIDLRKLLAYELTRLNYKGNRKNYQESENWINNLQHLSPLNIESRKKIL
jgi:hypothetical protein